MGKKLYIDGLLDAHKAANGPSKKAISNLIDTHVQNSMDKAAKRANSSKNKLAFAEQQTKAEKKNTQKKQGK
jgi:hypothetical protein